MYGFIGYGKMARAIAGGMVNAGICSWSDIMASATSIKKVGEITTTDSKSVAEKADVLFLCVKPAMLDGAVADIKDVVSANTVIVSIVAGRTISYIENLFNNSNKIKLIRTMPNTPALVGEAMTGISANEAVSKEELDRVVAIFSSMGEAEVVPEKLMDVVTGVSGSSPAYVYMFIEAMADAAVAEGMPRAAAYKFAAQSVKGAAAMVLSTGEHPGKLKDDVTSPGGTTIEAVAVLEEKGMRAAVIAAERACIEKSRKL